MAYPFDGVGFSIPGEPIAKGRAKVTTIAGHARMYTPKKTVNYESKVALFAHQFMRGYPPFECAISLSFRAVFQIPSSWSKKRRAANLEKPELVVKRPDLDNLIKALCDGMNGIVFKDDCQVAHLGECSKVYGESPRVDVSVKAFG